MQEDGQASAVTVAARPSEPNTNPSSKLFVAPAWWAAPFVLVLLTGSIGPMLAFSSSAQSSYDLWLTPKLMTGRLLAISLADLVVFAVVMAIAARRREPSLVVIIDLTTERVEFLLRTARVCARVSFAAYLVWGAEGLVHGISPAELYTVLQGEPHAIAAIKARITPISGITTLTQLAPILVGIWAVISRAGYRNRTLRNYVIAFVLLALARTIFYAERLAIIEMVLPALAVWAITISPVKKPRINVFRRLFPIFVPIILLVVFGFFEYSRSWANYWRGKYNGSYPSFVGNRLGGYYATASDNSALILNHIHVGLPFYTLKFFWRFPGVSSSPLSYESLSGAASPDHIYAGLLASSSNPEFNNEGGILSPQFDYGSAGGLVFWAIMGILFGLLWRSVRSGSIGALILMSVSYVGFFEIDRYLYWSAGRYIPAAVGGAIVWRALIRLDADSAAALPDDSQGRHARADPARQRFGAAKTSERSELRSRH